MKLGVLIRSFGTDFFSALQAAGELGLDGVQCYVTNGEAAIDTLTAPRIRALRTRAAGYGLAFSAVCADFGGGFTEGEADREKLEKTKRALALVPEFGCRIVTSHIGKIPEQDGPALQNQYLACRELGEAAARYGSFFAIETGPEPGVRLAAFLGVLGCPHLRVNFDPANLVMLCGERPEQALTALAPYVVHVHAKDGIRDPAAPRGFRELPLGQGDVDFDRLLPALRATGYDGFLTLEREAGAHRAADIAAGAAFLRARLLQGE